MKKISWNKKFRSWRCNFKPLGRKWCLFKKM